MTTIHTTEAKIHSFMAVNGEHAVEAPNKTFDTILVLDFGSQYSHLITRRLRDIQVYSELQPCTIKITDLPWTPKGIILSGGPYSVYDIAAPHVDPAIFDLGLPVLGICYGMQEIAWHFGKNVLAGEKREYGHAKVNILRHMGGPVHFDRLLQGLGDDLEVYMSHADKLSYIPDSFFTIAATSNAPFAGIVHNRKPLYGVQFHPEVTHTPRGKEILKNFAVDICEARQHWTMEEFVTEEIERIRTLVGNKGQVIGAVSGGVDSTVAAKLMDTAIGDRFHAVLIDNGLLRKDEAANVHKTLTKHLGIQLTVIDASERFLADLKGITDPEEKRKVIGSRFIREFQNYAKELEIIATNSPKAGDIEWLLQGTLYPDVIESISFKGPSQTIKTHHNVGGLPSFLQLKLIEPLRLLFKDEVRVLGTKIGITESLVWRHPFPGPGLGIRVLGEITERQLRIAREADHIFISELIAYGLYRQTSQAFAALIPTRAVGVMGDKRVYGQMISLRAVTTSDFMTASRCNFDIEHRDFLDHVSSRITNEIEGITRVLYDVTSKPPGTIEME
ncbi:MAG: hypothetical protein Q9217_000004 [Psora testacea]